MMPHGSEEIQARLQPDSPALGTELAWPELDSMLLAMDNVTVAVQFMGKLPATVSAPPNASADQVVAMAAEPKVARLPGGMRMMRHVHVPSRTVHVLAAR
jgi:leucyl-tRNA synthetase